MLGAGIGGYIIEYALNLFLAHSLASEDYGDFKVAMSFLALSAVVVLLGGDRAAPRFLPPFLETDERSGVWDYVRTYLIVTLGLSVVVAAVTIALSYSVFGGGDPLDHHPIVVASLVAPLAAVVTLLGRLFLAAKRVGLAQLPWRIGYPLLLLSFVFVASFVGEKLTDIGTFWILMIVAVLIIAIQVFFVYRNRLMPLRRYPDLDKPKQWIVASIPMMLVGLMQIGMSQTDIFMIELVGRHESAVGHYGAVTTTVYIIVLAQTIGVSVISPLISDALTASGDQPRALQERGFRLLFWLVVPLTVAIIVFAPTVMSFFGDEFVVASPALQILIVGYCVSSVLALSPLWLQYAGKERVTMWVTIVVFVVNIVLNAVLVPLLGIDGAAISTTVSLLAAALVLSVLLRRDLSMSPWPLGPVFTGLFSRKAA